MSPDFQFNSLLHHTWSIDPMFSQVVNTNPLSPIVLKIKTPSCHVSLTQHLQVHSPGT